MSNNLKQIPVDVIKATSAHLTKDVAHLVSLSNLSAGVALLATIAYIGACAFQVLPAAVVAAVCMFLAIKGAFFFHDKGVVVRDTLTALNVSA